MPDRTEVQHLVIIGDSLSDEGTMDHRHLFGFIPMALASGLQGKSPEGCFTNGWTWVGDLAKEVARDAEPFSQAPDLHNPDAIELAQKKHQDFMRTYCEGGMTAHDYKGRLTANVKLLAEDQILSSLEDKRKQMLLDDEREVLTLEHKAKTVLIEWSGANDLITINDTLSEQAVCEAVGARIVNVEELLLNGYKQFVLFNLPDLSLTPRYQAKTAEEQKKAHDLVTRFNTLLSAHAFELQDKHPNCGIHIYDANAIFTDAYNNPATYSLEATKLKQPFTTSLDFVLGDDAQEKAYAKGYMFWDDVHPTAAVHQILAQDFYNKITGDMRYQFSLPNEYALALFREHYGHSIEQSTVTACGCTLYSPSYGLGNYPTATLQDIFEHALYAQNRFSRTGARTLAVLQELGWIGKDRSLITKHPHIAEAYNLVVETHTQKPPLTPSAGVAHNLI